ncbi:MAG: carbohydrate-binding family 9-like protein [bacterium]
MRETLLLVCALAAFSSGCKKRHGNQVPGGVDRSNGALPALNAAQVPPGAIRVDGRLGEAAWKRTQSTGPFVHPGHGREVRSPVAATAQLAWDSRALYVGFVVLDKRPSSPFPRDAVDPHIWARASGVELMIQPGDPGNNRHYYELQVDVHGAIWDTRFDDYNRPITRHGGGRRYGHQQWVSGVERTVVVDRNRGQYTVELALPWSSLKPPPGSSVAIPPKPGDVWRINLYSFRDGQRAALAWSPLLGQGNFHRASRFGRVTFVGPSTK